MLRRLAFDILEKGLLLGQKYISLVTFRAGNGVIDIFLNCSIQYQELEVKSCDLYLIAKNVQVDSMAYTNIVVPDGFEYAVPIVDNFSVVLDFWLDPCCMALARKADSIKWWPNSNWSMNDRFIEKCVICGQRLPNIHSRRINQSLSSNRFSSIVDKLEP